MFGILSTITAHPALHSLKKTCGAGTSFDTGFTSFAAAALAAGAATRGARFRVRAGRRDPDRDVRDTVMIRFLTESGKG